MKRLAVSVEGQTEEEFVKSVLSPYLYPSGIAPTPLLIGRARGGIGGGDVNVERLASDMANLYWNFDFVTSLVDFYGFRGKGDRTIDELEQQLNEAVQANIQHGWDRGRVIPYIQKHEFEGLLFSDVKAFGAATYASEGDITRLSSIRSLFPTPEDINDHPDTAPSKRIANVIVSYQKRLHGPPVAEKIGLDVIREQCPRFGDWISRLESLGN